MTTTPLRRPVTLTYILRLKEIYPMTGSCNCWMSSGVFSHFAICCCLSSAVFRPSFVVFN